jgi:tRNA threonylcarbamoyladenosine biosynthesis protein TsaB
MDARRGQLYNALFKIHNGKIIRLTEDRAISVENLMVELRNSDETIEFVGDGAIICYNSISKTPLHVLTPERNRYITASSLAFAAAEAYDNNNVSSACDLSVNYIRMPQAERLLKENKLKFR